MAYKDVSGSGNDPIGSWESIGQVVEGRVTGTKAGKTFTEKDGTVKKSRLLLIDGKPVGMPSVLANAYDEARFKIGDQVRITFVGKPRGKTYKDFKIEVDDSPAPAGGTAPATPDASDPLAVYESKLAGHAEVGPDAASAMFKAIRRQAKGKQVASAVELLGQYGIEAA